MRKIIMMLITAGIVCTGCAVNDSQDNTHQITPNTEQISNKGDHIDEQKQQDNTIHEEPETQEQLQQNEDEQEQDQQQSQPNTKVVKPEKRDVKGIYLNRNSLKEENIDYYINLVKSTNLNAVVIDLKDDYGKIVYDSDLDAVNEFGSDSNAVIDDLEKFLQRFKEEDIYTIARIVTFKDPYLAEQKTDYSLKRKDGTVWSDAAGVKWIDPHKKEVWDYVTDISQEIASLGIDEIQYDYIRFPENAKKVDQEVQFDNPDHLQKSDVIEHFLTLSNEKLTNYPVYVSADVFGLVTTATDDMGIGQVWEKISPMIDYISPMTYPSHYAPNTYGIANPDEQPYDLMKKAMQDANARNQQLEENSQSTATIRPWIQDFDYKSNYNETDVRNQIKAIEEEGITQYLFWNASNEYTESAFN